MLIKDLPCDTTIDDLHAVRGGFGLVTPAVMQPEPAPTDIAGQLAKAQRLVEDKLGQFGLIDPIMRAQ